MSVIHRPGGRRRAVGLGAALLAVALAVAGCSGSSKSPSGTTAPGRQATPTRYPLTGLQVEDPAVAARPALSVKVENVAAARPQAGLNAADLVTEELVEGGLTRLLVTFQSRDAALVGPVRSVRPVDAPLLHELGGGLFGFSGGSAGVLAEVRRSSEATFLEPGRAPGPTAASPGGPRRTTCSPPPRRCTGPAARPTAGWARRRSCSPTPTRQQPEPARSAVRACASPRRAAPPGGGTPATGASSATRTARCSACRTAPR
jgi:hypothetical protein